ncbi:heavy-metal-associated domain-containing protein [Flavobacterium sp.]|uniref:heavy-metal-associated domain-containing protein n=1 Tax=Flavobacterium sp. TaxID=239 RepID=UPI0040489A85
MKSIKTLALIALTAIAFTSCKKENTETPETKVATATSSEEVAANLETASFHIDGMTCEIGCAKLIEDKLSGLEGVNTAKVDFENKTATVTFENGKQTEKTLVKTVEGIAGGELYKVSEVKSSTDKA